MGYPSLSKSGVTTVTFPRGYEYGDDLISTPRQRLAYSEAGQVRVATLGVPDQVLPVAFVLLPTATVTALLAFLNNVLVDWAANTVTWTDVAAVAWLVRVIDSSFTRSHVASGLCNVRLTLRVEVV